jgi:hypothetical protein
VHAVHATDDNGQELDAEYSVEPDGDGLALILESSGGKVLTSTRPRNADYTPALAVLLRRLQERDAFLLAALVDSRNVRDLAEHERTLIDGPVQLTPDIDVEELRRRLTSAQGRIGQRPDAPKAGNNRKRIRLRLAVPGYGPGDAGRLQSDLAVPDASGGVHGGRPVVDRDQTGDATGSPDALELIRSLIGVPLMTVAGRPNRIVAVDTKVVQVATDKSPAGQPVKVEWVQAGLDLLMERRFVRVHPDELGYRSAFIGAVLATLPGAVASERPATVALQDLKDVSIPANAQFAVLDGTAQVKIRKEQGLLRRLLVGDRASAECALCQQEFPLEFLVAAHIKRRSVCNDQERTDMPRVAMLACTFGCDSLYEAGYVTVDQDGIVRAVSAGNGPQGRFRSHLEGLHGRHCTAHQPASEPYFAWHRNNIFRGQFG